MYVVRLAGPEILSDVLVVIATIKPGRVAVTISTSPVEGLEMVMVIHCNKAAGSGSVMLLRPMNRGTGEGGNALVYVTFWDALNTKKA